MFDGPVADVEELRANLPADCEAATVSLETTDSGYSIELRRNNRRAHRNVNTLESASAWLESWLMPGFELPEETSTAESTEPDPTESDQAEPDPTELAPLDLNWRLNALLRLTIDTDLFGWLSSEFGAEVQIQRWSVGLAGHFEYALGEDSLGGGWVVRGGYVFDLGRARWINTLGLGYRWIAERKGNDDDDKRKVKIRGIPFLELRSDVAIPLSTRVSLTVGLDARVALSKHLARFGIGARIGLSFSVGQ